MHSPREEFRGGYHAGRIEGGDDEADEGSRYCRLELIKAIRQCRADFGLGKECR